MLEIARQIADAPERGPFELSVAPFDAHQPETDESNEAIATVVPPDIALVCDPSKLDERNCRESPDWIVEVLSSSSVKWVRP